MTTTGYPRPMTPDEITLALDFRQVDFKGALATEGVAHQIIGAITGQETPTITFDQACALYEIGRDFKERLTGPGREAFSRMTHPHPNKAKPESAKVPAKPRLKASVK